jgi:DNA modification methylase
VGTIALQEVADWGFQDDEEPNAAAAAFRNLLCDLGIITSDTLLALRRLRSNTFNVVVTSPPYYWARDYGVEGQIGHEDTVDEYVAKLADVFDEVKRVLHPDGVFYLNMGDTYYSGNGQPHGHDPRSPSRGFMRRKLRAVDRSGWDLPKKSLIGVPWKVAFALQERGWTLRSDIVWNRGNAFVEPTALDRPYRQHEHIFMFTKSRFYSYDRTALEGEENVWNIPIERNRDHEHSAAFPAALVRRCILTGSPLGGHVLDPFVGSGTTLKVASHLGRNSVGIDISCEYMAKIRRYLSRQSYEKIGWQDLTKTLSEQPDSWRTWRGNKANFKKPRLRVK